MSEAYDEAHSAVAVAIAERFLAQPRDMAWEERTDQLATVAIEAMQIFISMRPVVQRYNARIAAQGTPTRRAETTGSVGEADGGPVAESDAPKDAPTVEVRP